MEVKKQKPKNNTNVKSKSNKNIVKSKKKKIPKKIKGKGFPFVANDLNNVKFNVEKNEECIIDNKREDGVINPLLPDTFITDPIDLDYIPKNKGYLLHEHIYNIENLYDYVKRSKNNLQLKDPFRRKIITQNERNDIYAKYKNIYPNALPLTPSPRSRSPRSPRSPRLSRNYSVSYNTIYPYIPNYQLRGPIVKLFDEKYYYISDLLDYILSNRRNYNYPRYPNGRIIQISNPTYRQGTQILTLVESPYNPQQRYSAMHYAPWYTSEEMLQTINNLIQPESPRSPRSSRTMNIYDISDYLDE
jgi:hypothetical protein